MDTIPGSTDALLASSVLDASPCPVVVLASDWTIRYCNHAFSALLPSAEEATSLGADLFTLLPGLDATPFRDQVQRAMRGETVRFEVLHPVLPKWFAFSASALGDDVVVFGNDVTAHQRREAELEAANSRLGAILNSVPDPMLALNPRLEVLAFNRAYAEEFHRVFQMPVHVGVSLYGLLAEFPEALASALANWERAAVRGEDFTVSRTVHVDGEASRVFSVRYGSMRDEQGRLIGAVSTMRDISDQVRDREERRQLTARLDAVIRYSPDRVVAVDRDLRIVAMNEHARDDFHEMWGVPISEGDSLRDKLSAAPPEMRDAAFAMWEEAVQGKAAPRFSSFGRGPGSLQAYEISFGALRDEAGQPSGAVMVAKDVSDRELALNALRDSERRFRALGESSPIGIFLADEHGVCTYANPRLQEIWELRESQLREGGLLGAVHDEDRPALDTWLASAGAAHEFRRELRVRLADGLERAVSMRCAVIRDELGMVIGHVGTVDDVTEARRADAERLRMEQQIQRAQKLESLEVLAGGIAHDFNNLLVGVLGNASLALLDLPHGAPARAPVVDIERAAQRAADLTRQMLAYSGRGQFLVEPVELSSLVSEMGALLRTVLAKGVVLETSLAYNLPPVEADATQIRQVVMNLITNASDAVAETGGRIFVRTGAQELLTPTAEANYMGEVLPAGRYLYVEVEDTGHGMDAETLSRIFEPFYTTKFTGRGLGLAATRGIVRGHRGAIRIRSEPGRGSSFRVLLPEAHASAAPRSAAVAIPERLAQGTVLIIDDDETMRVVSRRLLERRGFTVVVAADGEEGVARYKEIHADVVLVLLDLTMPRMGGVATLAELRKVAPSVRVLLTSGYSEQEVAKKFIGVEPLGFLQKPFRGDELYGAVVRALRTD